MGLDSLVAYVAMLDTYEMYRDFQENTINSDGSFGMWFVIIFAIYLAH
jgi:hypothetical protein